MKKHCLTACWICSVIGLTAGNFMYQYATKGDYMLACERSWFQLTAIFTFILVQVAFIRFWPKDDGIEGR